MLGIFVYFKSKMERIRKNIVKGENVYEQSSNRSFDGNSNE